MSDVARRAGSARLTRYLAVGGVSFVVDEFVLILLTAGLGVAVVPATVAAYCCGLAINFQGQRRWTFPGGRHPVGRQFGRYLVLVGLNLAVTVAIVAGLSLAAVPPWLGKIVAVAVLVGVNLVAYRRWVYQ